MDDNYREKSNFTCKAYQFNLLKNSQFTK